MSVLWIAAPFSKYLLQREFLHPPTNTFILIFEMDDSNISLSRLYDELVDKEAEKVARRHMIQPVRQPVSPQLDTHHLTVENNSLKDYIEELCQYINDTSAKYSRNIETLSKEYRALYLRVSEEQTKREEERLVFQNQLAVERDLRLAREQEADQLKVGKQELEQQITSKEHQITQLKEQIDSKWEQAQKQKQIWTEVLTKMEQEQSTQSNLVSTLSHTITLKDVEIKTHLDRIQQLEKQLLDRHNLPAKINNCEMKVSHGELVISSLREKVAKLEEQLDMAKRDYQQANKQREEIRIKNTKFEDSFATYFNQKLKEHEDAWNDTRRQLETTISMLKLDNSQKDQQLQDLAKQNNLHIQALRNIEKDIAISKKEFEAERQQKELYLEDFRKLKKNYESVISTLQGGFKELQQKNWDLEEQKRDLEEEVDKFRELVKELAHINDFATAGNSEYYVRQINKLQQSQPNSIRREEYILARQEAVRESAAERFNKLTMKPTKQEIDEVFEEDEMGDQWSNLLKGINNIDVRKKH